MSDDTPFVVEPVAGRCTDGHWTPDIGSEAWDFLQNIVPQESRQDVQQAAVSILAKGVTPKVVGQETGLVIGYVQSGKTMSFESVAALARDNAFQIVIIIAGRSNPLLDQSTSRLHRDFKINDPTSSRRWVPFRNPPNNDITIQALRDVLADWDDPETPSFYKRTVLITVLKNYRHLQNLSNVIGRAALHNITALIIDDEADQASLNTQVSQQQESTIYRCLMSLRQALPSHTYLQYTATPQAPLLVNIIDSLSPNFVQIIRPGDAYVGGKDFFNTDRYVRVIPPSDIPADTDSLRYPPESLLRALRVFIVGATVGLVASRNTGNRSMLIHPSHRTTQHEAFCNRVREILEEWKRILNLPSTDPDRVDLTNSFREAHNDLADTVESHLPPFGELAPSLSLGLRNTRVLEVNAREGSTPAVDWHSAYAWILVGGQAMDRGFTVEGLTVTYMPRGIGVGNADAVQQRARFFGYKRSSLGFCRIYLELGTLNAFRTYVDHEEDIRGQLVAFQNKDRPLNEWRRAFVLDTALRPCRNSVVAFEYMHGQFSDSWVAPRVVLAPDHLVQANRESVSGFLDAMAFADDDGHRDRTETQRHEVCRGLPLRDVLTQLLVPMRIAGTGDSQRNTGMLLQLSYALENDPDEICTVYRISPQARRSRSVDEHGEISNLFQGAAPVNPPELRGTVYPGDLAIRDACNVTIQIHRLDLTQQGEKIMNNVPVVAVWMPARLAQGWLIQDQPTQAR